MADSTGVEAPAKGRRKESAEKGSFSRRDARARALQALFQVDFSEIDPLDALVIAFKSEESRPAPDVMLFAEALVSGVVERRAEIDALIEKQSHHWRVERMARVDRNVLRLAVFELLTGEVPQKVIFNEAIELAKQYGSEESGAFVNGILDKLAARIRRES